MFRFSMRFNKTAQWSALAQEQDAIYQFSGWLDDPWVF